MNLFDIFFKKLSLSLISIGLDFWTWFENLIFHVWVKKKKTMKTMEVIEKSTWRINLINLFFTNKSNEIGKEK